MKNSRYKDSQIINILKQTETVNTNTTYCCSVSYIKLKIAILFLFLCTALECNDFSAPTISYWRRRSWLPTHIFRQLLVYI